MSWLLLKKVCRKKKTKPNKFKKSPSIEGLFFDQFRNENKTLYLHTLNEQAKKHTQPKATQHYNPSLVSSIDGKPH